MRPLTRLLAALVIAGAAVAAPTGTVLACSCAWLELPEAIGEAEIAFVGQLVDMKQAREGAGMGLPAAMTWAVERSRGPIDADHLVVAAWQDDGANCGVSFGIQERWLVLAYVGEHGPETNGCMRNVRLDNAPPEELATIEQMIAIPVDGSTSATEGIRLPTPVLVGGSILALVAAVSLIAFRRADASDR